MQQETEEQIGGVIIASAVIVAALATAPVPRRTWAVAFVVLF